jgi:hypothetical protein
MKHPPLTSQQFLAALKETQEHLKADEADTQRLIVKTGFQPETIHLYKTICRVPRWILSKCGPNATWRTRFSFKYDMAAGLLRQIKYFIQIKILKYVREKGF